MTGNSIGSSGDIILSVKSADVGIGWFSCVKCWGARLLLQVGAVDIRSGRSANSVSGSISIESGSETGMNGNIYVSSGHAADSGDISIENLEVV